MLGIGPRSIVSRPPLWLLLSGSAAAQAAALNGAQTLLDGETDGLAFDFTDQSAYIVDTGTPANDYDSTGIVSSGSLVGPSGKLTYTSPSNKLTMQSDGYIKYQAHNLITYSEQFDNAAWTKTRVTVSADAGSAPDGTATADAIIQDNTTLFHVVGQIPTLVVGATYVVEFRLKYVDWQYLQINFGTSDVSGNPFVNIDIQNGTISADASSIGSISSIGDGWHLVTVTVVCADASFNFNVGMVQSSGAGRLEQFAGDNASSFLVWGAHVYRYPANTDYIRTSASAVYALPLEYSATDGSCLGLLVEEARTNLCIQSNNLSNAAWATVASGDAKTGSAAVGPFGATDMTSLTEGTATDRHIIASTSPMSTTAAATYTVSAFIRKGSRDYLTLGVVSSPTNFYCVTFNATTGAQTQSNGGSLSGTVASYGAEDCGGGLLRLWVTGSHNGSASYAYVSGATSGTPTIGTLGAESYLGVASTIAFYATQIQLEAGSFPTSPIITYGAAATRAADKISIATSAFPYSVSTQSIYVEAQRPRRDEGGRLLLLDDGNNYLMIQDNTTNIATEVRETSAGVTFGGNHGDHSIIAPFKVALAAAANNASSCMDGGSIQTDVASVTMPTSLTRLAIGSAFTFSWFNGHIRAVSAVPRRKSDAELQTETT